MLDQATRVLGVKTHSAAVNLALAEILRVRKIQNLPQFFGRGLWKGDLEGMREDSIAGRASLHEKFAEPLMIRVNNSVWIEPLKRLLPSYLLFRGMGFGDKIV